MKAHRQVFYAGRVQGVGFRYSVKRIASGYEVTGWVRNLPDGRVQVLASGDAPEVEAFLAAVEESHLQTHIKEASHAELAAPPDTPSGFHIRH